MTRTTALLTLVLAACGGTPDAPADHPVLHDTTDPAATAPGPSAPTVTWSPGDGARGVLVDDPVVLVFSEPMDTASVEAAWSSASLPASAMRFSWDPTGTILTVDASAVLEHPAGGPDVDTFGYEVQLDATAVDADGDVLGAPLYGVFETARDVTLTLRTTSTFGDGTGSFDGDVSTVVLRAGDTETNATWRSFLTFPLDALPQGVVQWEEAELSAVQDSVYGSPYPDLGVLTAGRVPGAPAIDAVSYSAARLDVVGLSDDGGIGEIDGLRAADALDAVIGAWDDGEDALMFRLDFDVAWNDDGDEDAAIFASPLLTVRVLAE